MSENSLYDRLGGVFAIAAVVDHFSDAIVKNPIVGQESVNPQLREWHTEQLGRLPGLKFMRTLWVCNVAGGPFEYTATHPGSTRSASKRRTDASRSRRPSSMKSPRSWAGSLDAGCPATEKEEVLAAFAAHKGEVTEGSLAGTTA